MWRSSNAQDAAGLGTNHAPPAGRGAHACSTCERGPEGDLMERLPADDELGPDFAPAVAEDGGWALAAA